MRRRVSSVSLVALLGTALAARADVAPFPSWRLVANGAITAAVQSGDAVFVGGSFTKIGRAVVGFDAFVDPATLDLITDPGCARDGDTVLTPFDDGNPRLVPYSSRLRDAVGPFVLEPSVSFVRVMACR